MKLVPHVSFSRLETISTCALKHFLKYELWLKEQKSPNLFFGTAVHDGLEMFHKNIRWVKGTIKYPDIAQVLKMFTDSWASQIFENEVDFSGKGPSADEYNSMGIGLFRTYITKGLKEGNPLFVPPIGTEYQFQIPLINLFTGEIITEDFELMGKIDLVVDTKEHGLVVMDHKTSAQKYQEHKVKLGMQLTMYAYAVRFLIAEGIIDTEKVQEDKVGYNVFLKYKRPEVKPYLTTRVDADMHRFYKYVEGTIKLVQSKLALPQEGMHCSWCDFHEPCQLFGTPWFDKFIEEKLAEREAKEKSDEKETE